VSSSTTFFHARVVEPFCTIFNKGRTRPFSVHLSFSSYFDIAQPFLAQQKVENTEKWKTPLPHKGKQRAQNVEEGLKVRAFISQNTPVTAIKFKDPSEKHMFFFSIDEQRNII